MIEQLLEAIRRIPGVTGAWVTPARGRWAPVAIITIVAPPNQWHLSVQEAYKWVSRRLTDGVICPTCYGPLTIADRGGCRACRRESSYQKSSYTSGAKRRGPNTYQTIEPGRVVRLVTNTGRVLYFRGEK